MNFVSLRMCHPLKEKVKITKRLLYFILKWHTVDPSLKAEWKLLLPQFTLKKFARKISLYIFNLSPEVLKLNIVRGINDIFYYVNRCICTYNIVKCFSNEMRMSKRPDPFTSSYNIVLGKDIQLNLFPRKDGKNQFEFE